MPASNATPLDHGPRETPRPAQHELYWEDFTPGRRFDCGERRVPKEEILEFARLYDPQRFHLDEEFCATTIYGGLIASGGHVWATCMGLVATALFNRSANMGSPGMDNLRWHRPMRPGDLAAAAVEVLGAEPASRPAVGKLKLRFELRNQHGEEIMTAVVNVLMGRRAPAGG
jgi:acyl dehydratase